MAMVIAITGIDGSGKTTTAKTLTDRLRDEGYSVQYRHQFNSIFARVLNAVRAKKTNVPPAETSKREADSESVTNDRNSAIKKLTAYLFLFFQALSANRARLAKHDFLVFDRYFYDDFVRFRQKYDIADNYFFLVEKLVPRPVLLTDLGGDVHATYSRQVDIDSSFEKYVEKLRIHRATVENLKRLGLQIVSIDTTKHAQAEVVTQVMNALKGRTIR